RLHGAVGLPGPRMSCLARDGRRRVARRRRDPEGGGTEGGDTGSGDLVMTGQGATVTTGEDVLRHGGWTSSNSAEVGRRPVGTVVLPAHTPRGRPTALSDGCHS